MGKLDWGKWFMGLWAALIGGGSTGVLNSLTAMGLDPEHFNLNGGLRHTMYLFGAGFLVAGTVSVFMYLKQSPIPQQKEIWTEEQRQAYRESLAKKGN
jgi:hypothetical protein